MAKKTVLVVDDDPDMHALLAATLSSDQISVECVDNGEAALSRLREHPYDIVLTDILMPGMDGLTLLNRILEMRPETRVMVMTAENTPDNLISSIRARAFSYFSKPFAPAAVADCVYRALDSDSANDDIQIGSASPNWISLQVRCRLEAADRLSHFFREMGTGLPANEQDDIITAFRELLLNAIEHGGHSDPEKKVYLTYIRTPRALIYYIRDPGEGFSFDNLAHAAVSSPDSPLKHAEVRQSLGIRPGGFGILLTRKMADDVIYSEKGNEVLLIKYLNGVK